MNKKQLKYAHKVNREYLQFVYEGELLRVALENAKHRYAYVAVETNDDGNGWIFSYHRTAIKALRFGRLNVRYYEACHYYSRLLPISHHRLFAHACWERGVEV